MSLPNYVTHLRRLSAPSGLIWKHTICKIIGFARGFAGQPGSGMLFLPKMRGLILGSAGASLLTYNKERQADQRAVDSQEVQTPARGSWHELLGLVDLPPASYCSMHSAHIGVPVVPLHHVMPFSG